MVVDVYAIVTFQLANSYSMFPVQWNRCLLDGSTNRINHWIYKIFSPWKLILVSRFGVEFVYVNISKIYGDNVEWKDSWWRVFTGRTLMGIFFLKFSYSPTGMKMSWLYERWGDFVRDVWFLGVIEWLIEYSDLQNFQPFTYSSFVNISLLYWIKSEQLCMCYINILNWAFKVLWVIGL